MLRGDRSWNQCRSLGTLQDLSMPLPIPLQIRIMDRPFGGGIHCLSPASVSKTLETEDFFMGPTNIALVKLFQADLQLRAAQTRLEAASKDVRVQQRRVDDLAERHRLAQAK